MADFIAVALRANLLLDAHRVKSPGALQRNMPVKLVSHNIFYIK